MSLVVPILRFLILFVNVFDSYKVLKLPPPSPRNSDGSLRPSARAMAQRKRDMKGCLCMWIVWSVIMAYDRTAERFIRLFVPFYDEFKTIILLFLLLTRAKGSEIIFLHLIRPFVKPYTAGLDVALDLFNMLGNMIATLGHFSLAILPSVFTNPWATESTTAFHSSHSARRRSTDTRQSSVGGSTSRGTNIAPSHTITSTARTTIPPTSHILNNSAPRVTNAEFYDPPPRYDQHSNPRPEIWYPPPSSYSEEQEELNYPDFPSAYPPTPLVVARDVKPKARRRSSEGRAVNFSPLADERTPALSSRRRISASPLLEDNEEDDEFDVSLKTPRGIPGHTSGSRRHSSPLAMPHAIFSPALSAFSAGLSTVPGSSDLSAGSSESELDDDGESSVSASGSEDHSAPITEDEDEDGLTSTLRNIPHPRRRSVTPAGSSSSTVATDEEVENQKIRPPKVRAGRTPRAVRTREAPVRASARLKGPQNSVAAVAAANVNRRSAEAGSRSNPRRTRSRADP